MLKKVDSLDLEILEALGIYGPRNVSAVARKLSLPTETFRKRLKRLPSRIFLKFYTNIYHTNIGLKKALVFAEAMPGFEDLLFDSLKINDFWIYLSRCYGMNEGCIGLYTIPKDHSTDFERFIYELEKLGIARNIQIFWSTCFQSVNSKCNWFDEQSKTWRFPWDKWVEEIILERKHLPYTLIDPEDFPVKGDEIDIIMLKELEKNPIVSFVELAKMLCISPQLVRYHYEKHILDRGLIESFVVSTFHFDPKFSDMFLFVFQFSEMEKFVKFANSLLDKPFVGGLGKVLGKNALIAHIYLPRLEFRRFIDALSQLINEDLLQNYQYVIQDLRKTARQTIPYEYFKNGTWVYDYNEHIKGLHGLLERSKLKSSVILQLG